MFYLKCCLSSALCLRLGRWTIIFRCLHHRCNQFVLCKFVWKYLFGNSGKNGSILIWEELALKMNSKFQFFFDFMQSCIQLEFKSVLYDYLHRSKIKEEVYFLIEHLHNLNIQYAQQYILLLIFYFK